MKKAQHIFWIVCILCIVKNGYCQRPNVGIYDAFDSLIYQDVTTAKVILDSISSKIVLDSERGQMLKRKAILARVEARYHEALELNLEASAIFEEKKDTVELATIFHNLGFLMRYMKDYDKSISYYQKAIALRAVLQDSTSQAISHREIGVIYRRKNNYERAKYHYDKAKALFDPIKDKDEILTLQGNYASLYHVQKKYDLAIQINKAALPEIKDKNDPKSLSTRYANISSAYLKLKKYDVAYSYIDSAISVAQDAHLSESEVRYLLRKAKLASKRKDYKDAYTSMRKHNFLFDSLIRNTTQSVIDEQLNNFELEKLHVQDSISNILLQEKIKYEKAEKAKIGWIALAIVFIFIAGFVWQTMRVKLAKLKAKNKDLSARVLKDKLRTTIQENERLVSQTQLQLEFKKSIIEKVDLISSEHNQPEMKIRDLQRLLLDQLRLENQANVLNEAIEDMPTAYDAMLRSKYPELTKGERKMCFFVRNGLSIKEIAAINDTSTSAVQSMRYRIRKKMNIEKGKELQSFLGNL